MLVRNLKTKSDYEKSILSQEENLRLAIKNDQQISDARKKAKTGILPEPTQKMTRNTEQFLTDKIDIQNKALQNLLTIYEPVKANEFLNGKGKVPALTPDQLEYLNIFWEDIKKELLTKTGLTLAFFRRILKQSYAGRRSNYGFSTTRSNQTKVINTPEELSRIVPRAKYIDLAIQTAKPIAQKPELETAAKQVVRELAVLKRLVPVPGDFQKLTRLPPPKQAEYYQRFQEVFDGLATEEEEWDKVLGLDDESFLKTVKTLYPDSLDFKKEATQLYKDLRAEPDAVVEDVVVDEGLAAAEIEAPAPAPVAEPVPEPAPVAEPVPEPVAPKLPEEPEEEPLQRFVEFQGDDLEDQLEREIQRLEGELRGIPAGLIGIEVRRRERGLQDELNRVRYEQTIFYDKRLEELQEQRKEIMQQYKATKKKPIFIGVSREAELEQIQQQAFDIDQRMAGISAFLKERMPLMNTKPYNKTQVDKRAIRLRRKEKIEEKKDIRDEALANEYTQYALKSALSELALEKTAEEYQNVRKQTMAERRLARLTLQKEREQEERDLKDAVQYRAQLAYMANPPTPVRQLLSQDSFSTLPTEVTRLNPEVAAIRRGDIRRQQQYLSALQPIDEPATLRQSSPSRMFGDEDFSYPLGEPITPPLRASPAKPSARPTAIQEETRRPPPPKRRTTSVPRKSGKGVAVKENTWAQLGKFIVNEKKLSEGALQVKYEKGSPIPGYSRIMAISDTLQAILQDLIDTGRLRGVSELDSEERNRLETLLIKSGIGKGLGVKETTPMNEDAEKVKRFGIVKGIYDAGNNSTEVIHELRSLILYFVKTGRLDKRSGMDALQELQ